MNNMIFGKYVNNNSFMTKLDARFKLFAMLILVVFSFLDFHILAYLALFGFVVVLTIIGKLKFKPLLKVIKHMWFLMLILFIINLLTVTGEVLFTIGEFIVYKEAIVETVYIFLRLVIILMISNLLTCSTTPNDLTYAIEFYLTPLKIFKVNINEIALMMSIALRFIPTLFEEIDRIMKAQTSRGVDFKYGKYSEKLKALSSIIIPLFISCFERADDLTDAMIVKGYGMGKRSKYKRLKMGLRDAIAFIILVSFVIGVIALNGVIV